MVHRIIRSAVSIFHSIHIGLCEAAGGEEERGRPRSLRGHVVALEKKNLLFYIYLPVLHL